MGDVVNLRRARKRRALAGAQSETAAHRLAYGRNKNERRQSEAERESAANRLDAHRLEKPAADGD